MYQAPSTRKPVVEQWAPSEPDLANEQQLNSLKAMPSPVAKPNLANSIAPIPPMQERDIDTDLSGLKGFESSVGQNADKVLELKKKAADPLQQAKSSTLRKVLGVGTGVAAGLFTGNPLAGVGAYKAIEGAPERSRLKGIGAEISGLEGRNAAYKEQAGMNEKGLDFIEGRMGQKVDVRNQDVAQRQQDVTLAGQANAARTADLGASAHTMDIFQGNGMYQKFQLDSATGGYTKKLGDPFPDPELPIEVTPEMAIDFPGLQIGNSVKQSTFTGLSEQKRLANTSDTMEPESITVNGKGPVKAIRDQAGNYLDPNTRQPFKGKIGVYERPYSTGGSAMGAVLTPAMQTSVDQVAQKVASGEYTAQVGLSMLGGVRGGLGPALTAALVDKRVFPASVRTEATNIERGKSLLVPIRQLVEQINATPDLTKKAFLSAQLENYTKGIGTQFARAKGERGVVTNDDVNRVLGLIPGWKSANFVPQFAEENLRLIEETFDRDYIALTEKYFNTYSVGGGQPNLSGKKFSAGGFDFPTEEAMNKFKAKAGIK